MENDTQEENNVHLCSLVSGYIGAEIVSKEVLNNEPVFVNNERVHHWKVGAGLGIVGLLMSNSENKNTKIVGASLALLGAGIFLHDIDDFFKDMS